ncbi:hypothetical protein WJX74_006738 [Apatococcus lobatus]|uniref:NAD(P)-binding domain-containing protein n=1 Tax=Apatococcus lobatus TaxID=904363 RepID=A0AAW1RVS8_9CHLO
MLSAAQIQAGKGCRPERRRLGDDVPDRTARAIWRRHRQSRTLRTHGFQDELLDYVLGGPKLRKWYGAPDRIPSEVPVKELDAEANELSEEIVEQDIAQDSILVADGDSPMGEQIILQLILARAKLKALVRDPQAAKLAFGPYVKPIQGDTGNAEAVVRALAGCHTLVVPGRLGCLLPVASKQNLQHVLLLSSPDASGGWISSFLSNGKEIAAREAAVKDAGLPFTVIQTGRISDEPGAQSCLELKRSPDSSPPSTAISREDVASVVAAAAVHRWQPEQQQPPSPAGLTLSLERGSPGKPPEDWQAEFQKFQQ